MRKILAAFIISGVLAVPAAQSRDIDAIVSTDWLAQNLANPRLVIVDIRSAVQFQKSHIPGSVSSPFGFWAVSSNGLSLELPSDEALRSILGKAGITGSSLVVVVGRTETDFARADATRVAWTCFVAGLKNVAVLDGGFTKWARENKSATVDISPAPIQTYSVPIERSSVASKAYILREMKRLIIADNRIPEEYFGITSKPGHIKGAVCLPTPWVFNSDGTFKDRGELRSMAEGVLGRDKSKQIVTYCGVGGYASTWWFLLTQIFGYQNVKLYDASFEEWTKDSEAPVQSDTWH